MPAVAATNGAVDVLGDEKKAALTSPFLTGVSLSLDGGEPLV